MSFEQPGPGFFLIQLDRLETVFYAIFERPCSVFPDIRAFAKHQIQQKMAMKIHLALGKPNRHHLIFSKTLAEAATYLIAVVIYLHRLLYQSHSPNVFLPL